MELIKDNLSIAEFRKKIGIPFFEESKTIIHNPTYEFMTDEETKKHYNYLKRRSLDSNKPIGLYFFYEPFGLLKILEIEDLKYVNLISAFHPAFCSEIDENFATIYLEDDCIPKEYKINNEQDFIIIINDRISPQVKITIPPIESKHTNNERGSKYFTVGYLLWQTIKVYKDIYLYRKEEVVIGNIWDVLVSSSFQLYESNYGYISFDS